MIELMPYQSAYQTDLSYTLNNAQSAFSAPPSAWFTRDAACRVAIVQNGKALGFFVLDDGVDKHDYSNNPKALLLRSMSIHPAHQGRGIAGQALALLPAFCAVHLSDFEEIILGVNHDNRAAQRVYEKTGFNKTSRTVMGRSGEQWIYQLNLKH